MPNKQPASSVKLLVPLYCCLLLLLLVPPCIYCCWPNSTCCISATLHLNKCHARVRVHQTTAALTHAQQKSRGSYHTTAAAGCERTSMQPRRNHTYRPQHTHHRTAPCSAAAHPTQQQTNKSTFRTTAAADPPCNCQAEHAALVQTAGAAAAHSHLRAL